MSKPDFTTNIHHLRKAIKNQLIGQIVMISLALSLMLTAMAFFLQKVLQTPLNAYLIYPLLVGLALSLTLFYKFKFRKSFEEELGMLDHRFQLKEQLRTAYEIHQTKKHSFIGGRLIETAGASLQNIRFEQLYPHKNFRPFMVVCLLTAGSFFAIQHLPQFQFDSVASGKAGQNQLRQPKPISLKLENLTNNTSKKQKPQQKRQRELGERVKQFVEKKQRSDFSDLKAFKELRLMQQEVDAAKRRSANNLYSQISPDVASKIPSLEEFLEQGFNQEDIKTIEEELKKTFQEDTPSSISEELSALTENRELENLLNNLSEKNPSERQEKEGLLSELQANRGEGNSELDKPSFFTDEEYGGEEDNLDFLMRERSPLLPGDQAGRRNKKNSSQARLSRNTISKIPGLTGTGKRHSVKVQTLTMIGTAKVEEENVLRSYEQDLESAFQKEEIPLSYRQFIKNYFLSIDDRKKNDEGNSRR